MREYKGSKSEQELRQALEKKYDGFLKATSGIGLKDQLTLNDGLDANNYPNGFEIGQGGYQPNKGPALVHSPVAQATGSNKSLNKDFDVAAKRISHRRYLRHVNISKIVDAQVAQGKIPEQGTALRRAFDQIYEKGDYEQAYAFIRAYEGIS